MKSYYLTITISCKYFYYINSIKNIIKTEMSKELPDNKIMEVWKLPIGILTSSDSNKEPDDVSDASSGSLLESEDVSPNISINKNNYDYYINSECSYNIIYEYTNEILYKIESHIKNICPEYGNDWIMEFNIVYDSNICIIM